MTPKHDLDAVERHGLELHPEYAREMAWLREKQAKRNDAHAAVADLEQQLATEQATGVARSREEAALEAHAFDARAAGDTAEYERRSAKLEEFRRTKGTGRTAAALADARKYAAWLDREVSGKLASLAALEAEAVEFLGTQVVRPLHEQAVTRIDNALEEMLAAFQEEQHIRSVSRHALKKPGPHRVASMERLARYIRALGTLEQVGDLGALEGAVRAWRNAARPNAQHKGYKVRPDADRATVTARQNARQWA